MNCETVKEHLSALADGEILAGAEITAHLKNCEPCRREYGNILMIKELFRTAEKISGGEELSLKIKSACAPERIFMHRVLLTAASVAVFIFGAYAGKAVLNSPTAENASAEFSRSYSLASFDPLPESSLGGAYLSLMRNENEKQYP
jgi:anti-sigma factor RsiW